jgi:DNA-binding phage protein
MLQATRKYDRERSTKLYESTRPPDGTSLSYAECCLFEVFPVEEFDRLESGIRRLFPRMELKSSFGWLRDSADNLLAAGWGRIGTLVRGEERPFSAILPVEEMDLPECVRSVEVWAYRLLPSLFAVSLHAALEESATETLTRAQSSHYLSEVRSWPMIPTGWRHRSATDLADSVALRTMAAHLQHVRSEIEGCFAPFLSGYFMRRPGGRPRLPAVEIYGLKGTGADAESLRAWKAKARAWWTSMGFELYGWKTFQGSNVVFTLSGSMRTKEAVPYKLLVLQDEVSEDDRLSATEHFLRALVPVLAVRALVDSVAADVGKARRSVYRALSRRGILRGLHSDIGLSKQLSRATTLLERVSVELEDDKPPFGDPSLTVPVNDPEGHGVQSNLFDCLMHALKFQKEAAQRHVSVMAKSFSEHLQVRNMALMYRLQWVIIALTVIVAAAGTASSWNQIERFWHRSGRHEISLPPSIKTSGALPPALGPARQSAHGVPLAATLSHLRKIAR